MLSAIFLTTMCDNDSEIFIDLNGSYEKTVSEDDEVGKTDIAQAPFQNGIDINNEIDNVIDNVIDSRIINDIGMDGADNDYGNSDDTVIVDDYPVVFVDNKIMSYVKDIITEFNKIDENPKYDVTFTGPYQIPFTLRYDIQRTIRESFKQMVERVSDLKEALTRDYYSIKEFTSPLTLKFIKGSLNERYKYFSDNIVVDLFKVQVYNDMLTDFSFINLEKYENDIKLFKIKIHVVTNFKYKFNINNIIGKMNDVLNIVKQSDGIDLEKQYK